MLSLQNLQRVAAQPVADTAFATDDGCKVAFETAHSA